MGFNGLLDGWLYLLPFYCAEVTFSNVAKNAYILRLSQTLNKHISGVFQLQVVHLFFM
jgi:hypothetical protein